MRSSLGVVFPLLLCLTSGAEEQLDVYKLGGLFQDDDLQLQAAFAVGTSARPFLPIVNGLIPEDTVEAGLKTCQLIKEGVIGIIGPFMKLPSSHVQAICETTDMPHVVALPDELQSLSSSVVNIYPRLDTYSDAIKALILKKGWTSFTILYEDAKDLARVENLLHMHSPAKMYDVSIRQLDIHDDSYRPTLKELKKFGKSNYVLDCSIDTLEKVLVQAQEVGIMSDTHSYIITNPDLHTVDLERYQYGGANITGMRLLKMGGPEIESFLPLFNQNWKALLPSDAEEIEDVTSSTLRLNVALMYDAVKVYEAGLNHFSNFAVPDLIHDLPSSCESGASWSHGSTLVNFMRHSQVEGLTGHISFDTEGFRNNFTLDIVELSEQGIETIGTWNSKYGLEIKRPCTPQIEDNKESLQTIANKSVIVITARSKPYIMLKESTLGLTGNDRYEGFAIELIEELASILNFNYTFELQENDDYGSYDNNTKVATGMIKTIRDDKATFGITDLTVTSGRQMAVDFTSPFMNLGISILYKKPTEMEPALFSFMAPFSYELWFCVGSSLLGIAMLLFVLGRICPSEWQNPYPCIEEPEFLENQFTLSNALWFVLGSVLQQGSEIAPVGYSTRMLGSIWWFFTLIMTTSYTANLAAFLTAHAKFTDIHSAEELVNQNEVSYGAKKGGATFNFFKDSPNPTHQKMYEYMLNHPEMMTKDNDEGLEKVKTSKYAFLMESTSIEYMEERNCEVTQVGNLLDSKGYAIAMKKDSPYRTEMSGAVLTLQENGRINEMKRKWWKEKRGGGACSAEEEDMSQELDLENVGGVFFVLGVGCVCGVFIAILDMLWGIVKRAIKYNVPITEEIVAELKFIMRCSGDTKPVRHRMLESSSSSNSSESSPVELARLPQHTQNTQLTHYAQNSQHAHGPQHAHSPQHPQHAHSPQHPQHAYSPRHSQDAQSRRHSQHAHHAQHARRSRSFSPAAKFS